MTAPADERLVWPEQWAVQAMVDAGRIEHRMRVALAAVPRDDRRDQSEQAVRRHLAEARAACRRRSKRRWRTVRDRWRGTSVEQAYRNLHAAKIFLVDLVADADVDVQVAEVSARMGLVLDRNDPRRTEFEKALQSTDPAVRRAAMKQAMETAYDASDERYARLRDFRNIIVLTAMLITLFVGGLLLAVTSAPRAIPLCFTPSVSTAAPAEQPAAQVCPSGERQTPSPGDVLIVAGLGALGGGLAALFSIRNLRGTSTPYSLPVALAILKVPSGALTAVAGLLLLGGGFAPGFSNLDSQRQILAYALVLGYAQQLITRFADDRAQWILDRIPSKDPEAAQPQSPSAPQVPAPREGEATQPTETTKTPRPDSAKTILAGEPTTA